MLNGVELEKWASLYTTGSQLLTEVNSSVEVYDFVSMFLLYAVVTFKSGVKVSLVKVHFDFVVMQLLVKR